MLKCLPLYPAGQRNHQRAPQGEGDIHPLTTSKVPISSMGILESAPAKSQAAKVNLIVLPWTTWGRESQWSSVQQTRWQQQSDAWNYFL